MIISESKQIKIGSVLSYLQMFLGIIIGIVYTPVMIRLLGQSEYGLYNTVSSTISMLSILSLGFNSSYIRYYAKYKREDNEEAIYRLNGLFLIVFVIIGATALACGIFLTENLQLVFKNGLTETEYGTANVLMLLLTVNLALSFPMSVFSNIISAHERFIFLKLLGMLKTIVSPLVTLPLLLMGYKSIAMVTVSVSVAVITDLIYLLYVFESLKQRFVFHSFEKGLFKSILVYTSFIAINLIVDQINLNIDKLLLTRYKGTVAVAVYSVGFSLESYYQMFSTAISGMFTPRIHLLYNNAELSLEEKHKQLSELFTKVGRIQFAILALIASGLVFFGQSFIGFWAGDGYEESYYVALLLIIPITIPLIQNLGIEIQRAENKHQFRSIVYLIMALVNLVLSILLCKKYGAVGSAVGTAISLVLANGIIMNIYYQKKMCINIVSFWENIGRMSVGMIFPVILGMLAMIHIEISSKWTLLRLIIGYTMIYCVSMWLLGLNKYEKDFVLRALERVKSK